MFPFSIYYFKRLIDELIRYMWFSFFFVCNANLKKKYRKNGFYPYIFHFPILSFYLRVEHRAFSIKKKNKLVFHSEVGRSIEPIIETQRAKETKQANTKKKKTLTFA